MSDVYNNPPFTIQVPEELEVYQSLHDDIVRDGVILAYKDRHALADLAISLVEITELRKSIRTDGVMMTVEGDKGSQITKRNGACDVLDRKITAVHRLMKAFGMAPEYRPKKVMGGDPPLNGDDFEKI